MAELKAAVTDTHALLFHAAGGRGLGRAAAAHFHATEARAALIYVPVAVIWEVSLLARAGKANLRRTTRTFFDDLFTNGAYQPVDLTPEQLFVADDLRFNRDPFDALIVSAAQALELPLITRDTEIIAAGVIDVMW